MGCALSMCASCACSACTSLCCNLGMKKNNTVRGAKSVYLAFLAISTVLAIIFRYWGADSINLVAWKLNCKPPPVAGYSPPPGNSWDPSNLVGGQTEYYASCKGNAAVYRISFMTAMFFLIMTLGSAASKAFHTGLWIIKVLLYMGLITLGFFLPNYIFDNSGYAWFSRVCSVLFLMSQVLILVDFGYTWNDEWYNKGEKESAEGHGGCCQGCCGGWGGSGSRYFVGILSACAGCYIFFLTGIALLYTYYNYCTFNTTIITITLLLVLALTAVQLTTPAEIGGALLPAAVVTAYATYLCWSALANNPDETCFPTDGLGSHNNNPLLLAVGICITGVSLAWTTNTAASSLPGLFQHNKDVRQAAAANGGGDGFHSLDDGDGEAPNKSTAKAPAAVAGSTNAEDLEGGPSNTSNAVQLTGGEGERTSAEEEQEKVDAQHVWAFHLILCVGAIYMAMLLTNWGSAIDSTEVDDNGTGGGAVTRGKTAMWITILTQWTAVGMYLWTLCAPRAFPDRDFS